MPTTAPSITDFLEAFPQFGNVDGGLVQSALDFSARLLSASAWGEFYSDAVMLDAAHNLFFDSQLANGKVNSAAQLAVGTISSVSAAGMSTSFNSVGSSGKNSHADDWYNKTVYGQKFLRLRQSVIPSMRLCS